MKKRNVGFYFILAGILILVVYGGIALYLNESRGVRLGGSSLPSFLCPSSNLVKVGGYGEVEMTCPPIVFRTLDSSGNDIELCESHPDCVSAGIVAEAEAEIEALADCNSRLQAAKNFDCFPNECYHYFFPSICKTGITDVSYKVKTSFFNSPGDEGPTMIETSYTKVTCSLKATARASGSGTATCSLDDVDDGGGATPPHN